MMRWNGKFVLFVGLCMLLGLPCSARSLRMSGVVGGTKKPVKCTLTQKQKVCRYALTLRIKSLPKEAKSAGRIYLKAQYSLPFYTNKAGVQVQLKMGQYKSKADTKTSCFDAPKSCRWGKKLLHTGKRRRWHTQAFAIWNGMFVPGKQHKAYLELRLQKGQPIKGTLQITGMLSTPYISPKHEQALRQTNIEIITQRLRPQ